MTGLGALSLCSPGQPRGSKRGIRERADICASNDTASSECYATCYANSQSAVLATSDIAASLPGTLGDALEVFLAAPLRRYDISLCSIYGIHTNTNMRERLGLRSSQTSGKLARHRANRAQHAHIGAESSQLRACSHRACFTLSSLCSAQSACSKRRRGQIGQQSRDSASARDLTRERERERAFRRLEASKKRAESRETSHELAPHTYARWP